MGDWSERDLFSAAPDQPGMAFDAAIGQDVLLALYARKRGNRQIVTSDDAALLEWAKLHQEQQAIAARKRALEAVLLTRRTK